MTAGQAERYWRGGAVKMRRALGTCGTCGCVPLELGGSFMVPGECQICRDDTIHPGVGGQHMGFHSR